MNWAIAGQATFFLSVSLLAMVITVFVFATSLLGLAVEKATDEQEKLQEEQKQKTAEEIRRAQEQLNRAITAGDAGQIRAISKSLNRLHLRMKRDEKLAEEIPRLYTLPFTVKGGVVYPGACFVLAVVMSTITWSLGESNVSISAGYFSIPFAPVLWLLSAIPIALGLFIFYISLRAIQKVAITSEEVSLRRIVSAFKVAQREFEEERKPRLELVLKEPKPPIRVAPGATLSLQFGIRVAKGDKARRAEVLLYAPKGFDFPEEDKKWRQSSEFRYPDYLTVDFEYNVLLPGTLYPRTVILKAPEEKDLYTLVYLLRCEGFLGEYQEFNISVE